MALININRPYLEQAFLAALLLVADNLVGTLVVGVVDNLAVVEGIPVVVVDSPVVVVDSLELVVDIELQEAQLLHHPFLFILNNVKT